MSTQAILNQTTSVKRGSVGLENGALLTARLFAAFAAMLIALVVSGSIMGARSTFSVEAGMALLVVSLINSLALAYLILHSRWHGVKLMAAMFIIQFGAETFMSQIETLFFINAIGMSLDMLARVIGSGFVRALVFAPLAVIIFGKIRGTPAVDEPARPGMPRSEWAQRFAFLSILYVVVYFAFGNFVAYQWAEVRQYYAGTFSTDWTLPVFQVLRGLLWAALALLVTTILRGKVWVICLGVALAFAALLASGVIFPNPYMPTMVRQGHFVELSSSMLTYGAIAGWVWMRPGSRVSRPKP